MMFEADFHNFGQSVQRIGRGSEVYFRKPRPVYWEWLFFGRNSPLSSFFRAGDCADFLFNLDVEIKSPTTGISRLVAEDTSGLVSDQHLYGFGVLLCYAYVFGIRDLHANNVVKTKSHLQVIDAEVVLARLLLPHESLLLPYKDVGPQLCGAASIFNVENGLDNCSLDCVFDGYAAAADCFIRGRAEIASEMAGRSAEMNSVPIRHIARDTIQYRGKEAIQIQPFFDAEAVQLARGDIPYFFKYLRQNDVFTYADADGTEMKIELPEAFKKGAAREAVLPSEILRAERVKQLIATGALYLGKTLGFRQNGYKRFSSGLDIGISDSEIRVTAEGTSFTSSR